MWEGDFGTEYTSRNIPDQGSIERVWRKLLAHTPGIGSVVELGANRGHHLAAIQRIEPGVDAHGVEINGAAFEILRALPGVTAHRGSLLEFDPGRTFDLVYTTGVLIQLAPEELDDAYRLMHRISDRYILMNEYFNPTPVELPYRGHERMLFKRDFAGEILDMFPDSLRVVDYGFIWKRDEPMWDNVTWTLMEKMR